MVLLKAGCLGLRTQEEAFIKQKNSRRTLSAPNCSPFVFGRAGEISF